MTHVADQTDDPVFIIYCMSLKKKKNSNSLLSANVLL